MRFQFSLKMLLLVVTLVAVLLGAGTYLHRRMKLAAIQDSIGIRLENFLIAMHRSDESYGSLPTPTSLDSTGRPLMSWRCYRMLPYMESLCFDHPEYTQPWDSPANASWRQSSSPVLTFPHVNRTATTANDTNVFAITGPGTAFDPPKKNSIRQLASDSATKDVIIFAEVRNSKTNWMQPGDFDIRTMPHTINDSAGTGISGTCPGGFFVGFADHEVWMLSNDTPFAKLALFFTIDGAQRNDREMVLGPYRMALYGRLYGKP